MPQLPKFRTLLISRLSRRVAFWIFASIVLIEAAILIPSYYRRQHELLTHTETLARTIVESIIILKKEGVSEAVILESIPNLKQRTSITGIAIYGLDGTLMQVIGEPPKLPIQQVATQSMLRDRDRYDIAWSADLLDEQYTFIVRHDLTPIRRELYAYTGRILILVLIISVFVTGVMMLVLAKMVILPILRLREDLIIAGEALSQDISPAEFFSLPIQRQDELGDVMEAFNQTFNRINREINQRKQAEIILRVEQEKSNKLLLNILPEMIAEQLKQGHSNIAQGFSEATILFADIVGFTSLSARISPEDLVQFLNQIFSEFDRLTELHGLEKIKTIGDAYMVVGGIPKPCNRCAEAIAEMALDMQIKVKELSDRCGEPLNIRIGINLGPVVAGVIGTKKFSYDLWGDAVNIASRMESQGIPGSIQVTEAAYQRLCDRYEFTKRGLIPVKGKGQMTTYLLIGRKPDESLTVQ